MPRAKEGEGAFDSWHMQRSGTFFCLCLEDFLVIFFISDMVLHMVGVSRHDLAATSYELK